MSHQYLTAEQVESLNAGGALIKHGDASIAHVLLHTPFADKAMATQTLQAVVGGFKTGLGNKGFHDRGQKAQHGIGLLAFTLLLGIVHDVGVLGG